MFGLEFSLDANQYRFITQGENDQLANLFLLNPGENPGLLVLFVRLEQHLVFVVAQLFSHGVELLLYLVGAAIQFQHMYARNGKAIAILGRQRFEQQCLQSAQANLFYIPGVSKFSV